MSTACPIAPIQGKPPMCTPPSLIQKKRTPGTYHNILEAYGNVKKESYQKREPYSKANYPYDKFANANYTFNKTEPYCPMRESYLPKRPYDLYEPAIFSHRKMLR